MIGIDLTQISRFRGVTDAFINKILHPNERKEYHNCSNKEAFLAARWAIKEALYKTDNSLHDFSKIDIAKQDNKYVYKGYWISTSSEGDMYIATCIKEAQCKSELK